MALLNAREKLTGYKINDRGFELSDSYRVYCSEEAHSSVDKAVKIAGIGSRNLIKIPTDGVLSMNAGILKNRINKDIKAGKRPLFVVATFGTTSSTAIDPVDEVGEICKKNKIWLHVDAAYAGSALILEEYRKMLKGLEYVDSFVVNPHKWLFTNFDCSAFFVKDKESLVRTFQVVPEYLKSGSMGKVNDYSDWGIQLGRRFRALKLWFVIRNFGVKGLQEKLKKHIALATYFKQLIIDDKDFELVTPVNFNLVCFRYKPEDILCHETLNRMNESLLNAVNDTGKIYLTHTKLKGIYTLRMVTGQTNVEQKHVDQAWRIIKDKANIIKQ